MYYMIQYVYNMWMSLCIDDDYKVPPTYDSSEDDVMETEEENTKIIKTTPNSKVINQFTH